MTQPTYPNPSDLTRQLADLTLVMVGRGSRPSEPKNGESASGFSLQNRRNSTKPRYEHFAAKFFRSGEISAISIEILARSMEFSLDLARSRRIWWDFNKSSENITEISPLNRRILVDFQIFNSNRTDCHPLKVGSAQSDQPYQSATSWNSSHSI